MFADSASLESPNAGLAVWQRYTPGVLCGLAGFLSAFTISLGGQMPASELILLLVFPWVLVRAYFAHGWPVRLQQLGWFNLLLILAVVTAVGYVASDLYRGTAFNNLIRGWARVGFLVVDLVAVAFLVDMSWSRLRLFILALYLGRVVDAFISGPLHGEWWKFGVGYPISIFALWAVAGRGVAWQVVVAIVLAVTNFLLGARALGATCLLIGGLLSVRYVRGIWRPMVLFGSLGLAIGGSYAANVLILEDQNHEGSNIERQSMIETSLDLFLGSPLVGQGSWFTASRGLTQLEEKRAELDPTFRHYNAQEAEQLAIHSQLLAALAEGGILGGVFFLGLMALVLKTTKSLMWNSVPARAFIFYIVLAGGWNILMTPFSGVTRVEIALLVCACLLVILQRQGELPEEFRE